MIDYSKAKEMAMECGIYDDKDVSDLKGQDHYNDCLTLPCVLTAMKRRSHVVLMLASSINGGPVFNWLHGGSVVIFHPK